MTVSSSSSPDRLNSHLARLLAVGTWAACCLIMIGMLSLEFGLGQRLGSAHFVSIGIVLLIVLPTVRVATMAIWFLINYDRDFALVAALVLAIIVVSTVLGASAP